MPNPPKPPRRYPRSPRDGAVTRILEDGRGADRREILDRLLPLVYQELRSLARAHLRRERPDHTLQTTALVHEVYMRMLAGSSPAPSDRRHFFAAASQAMRRVLIDYARARGQIKRGGDRVRVTLGDVGAPAGLSLDDVLALDEAILRLERQDPRMAEVVRLRFFAGLSVDETALALELSERTVKREWSVARAWLFEALRERDESPEGGEP